MSRQDKSGRRWQQSGRCSGGNGRGRRAGLAGRNVQGSIEVTRKTIQLPMRRRKVLCYASSARADFLLRLRGSGGMVSVANQLSSPRVLQIRPAGDKEQANCQLPPML
jgi:hypothetical protein